MPTLAPQKQGLALAWLEVDVELHRRQVIEADNPRFTARQFLQQRQAAQGGNAGAQLFEFRVGHGVGRSAGRADGDPGLRAGGFFGRQ